MALVLAFDVEGPVFVEVAALGESPKLKDRLGPVHAPAGSRDVEAVADERATCAFDDAARDGGACLKAQIVVHEVLPLEEVIRGLIDGFALRWRQLSFGRAAPHSGGDVAGMTFEEALKALEHPLFELSQLFINSLRRTTYGQRPTGIATRGWRQEP